jgi:putative hydrolase of the HAD superfamily
VSEDVIFSTAQFFRVLSRDTLSLYDGVKELLDELKRKKKNVYLLSNAQEVFTIPEMKVLGLLSYFDEIYISSVIGIKKPDTRFMDALVRRENLEKSESIMIGNDQTTDIQIAKDFGMDSLYHA